MNQQTRKHIFILYVTAIAGLAIALGAAFGQRSDYLRLNMLGAPQLTPAELFTGHHAYSPGCEPLGNMIACNLPGTTNDVGRTFQDRWEKP